jgi:hypothetical protein
MALVVNRRSYTQMKQHATAAAILGSSFVMLSDRRKITDSELNSCNKLAPVLICPCIRLRECNF